MAEPLTQNPWADKAAPSLDDFEAMAHTAFDALPERFRALVEGVSFAVAEFPEDEDLKELEMESPFDLLGLFQGVGRPQGAANPVTGQMPNRIFLYRRPILDYWAESDTGETLGEIVTHVLIHEIGHHFGFDDADLEAIEEAAEED